MPKTIQVATNTGEFKIGEELTRGPAIAAYFTTLLNVVSETETTLSVDEIVRVATKTKTDGMSPDDAETTILTALQALERGEDDDTGNQIIDQDTANKRRGSAQRIASLLNGAFASHIEAILTAKALVAKGPFLIADDVAAKWEKDVILDMPVPGSKLKKEDKNDPSKANQVYDHYRVQISGEYVNGSWFDDIFASTPTGMAMLAAIDKDKKALDVAKDATLEASIKTQRKRYNDAVALLRRGVQIMRTLWACESGLPNLTFQVQRNPDGSPLETMYPIAVCMKSAMGTIKALTLGQFLSLDVPTGDDKLTGIERTIAKGGTLEALLAHGLPKKGNKDKNKKLAVDSVDAAFDATFKLGSYLDMGGSAAVAKMLRAPKTGDAWVVAVGDLLSHLLPMHDEIRYRKLSAPASNKDAA